MRVGVRLELDMVSEQRSLLGFMSLRQGVYCFVGIIIIYNIIKYVFKISSLFMSLIPSLICSLVFALPIPIIIFYIAFTRHSHTGYYRDKNFILKFANKHEFGWWRKGTSRNLVNLNDIGRERND